MSITNVNLVWQLPGWVKEAEDAAARLQPLVSEGGKEATDGHGGAETASR
ncbi:hypothetical protein MY11210_002601 [Beauveria gryllotalpidicola]